MEIDYGRFTRQIALSAPTSTSSGCEGDVQAGILTIVLPLAKKPVEPERVEIPIRSGTMTELMEEQIDIDELELPSTLPVLPLKDTVVFPDSVLPLAIGQERSVRLVEDVVSGNRLIALVPSKDRELEQPGWDDLLRGRARPRSSRR